MHVSQIGLCIVTLIGRFGSLQQIRQPGPTKGEGSRRPAFLGARANEGTESSFQHSNT